MYFLEYLCLKRYLIIIVGMLYVLLYGMVVRFLFFIISFYIRTLKNIALYLILEDFFLIKLIF